MTERSLGAARSLLQERFGYPDFRAGQVDVVRSVLDGHDTLAVLPTGGGKSLCYQVPALVIPGLTVVVSPLISLMKDQVDRLTSRGVAAAFLNSSLDETEQRVRMGRAAAGELKLLYVAPERLASRDVARALQRNGVALLAVDEAHCISEWGHEFRPAFRRLADVRASLGNPQTVALTATATPAVRRDIATQLRLRNPTEIVGGFDRVNLDYAVLLCADQSQKDETLLRLIRSRPRPAIVYAPTRLAVERVAKRLARCVRAKAYHGGLHDSVRLEVQDAFMSGAVDTIVATNAFGMGIDKPNVRLVVHHSMPGTLEAYYQEAGRAGRDGAASACILLHHADDRLTHDWFIRGTFPPRASVEQVMAALDRLREDRRVPQDPARIARHCKGVVTRDIKAALALLEREGVLCAAPATSETWIRLMATPARIRRELGADAPEVAVLRSVWRVGRDALGDGVVVDLARLSPPHEPRAARKLLQHLRDRQFVDFAGADSGLRVADDATLSPDALDWARIERRRATELHKLAMMERYTQTDVCRRAFVLSYFGEDVAAANCGQCDNCRGVPA